MTDWCLNLNYIGALFKVQSIEVTPKCIGVFAILSACSQPKKKHWCIVVTSLGNGQDLMPFEMKMSKFFTLCKPFLYFSACQTAVHKKCHDKLLGTCSESGFNSESTIVSMQMTIDSRNHF